jgi:molybdenum cofactor cytidylyltransferase
MSKITAILLAAGFSSRMKGENKMLLPFRENSILQSTYNQLKKSKVAEVIIVGGDAFQRLVNELRIDSQDSIVQNDTPALGMTSSIQTGLKLIKENAFMICLGDMPTLSTYHYNMLIDCYQEAIDKDQRAIAVPSVNGQQANPVIFSQSYREEILSNVVPNGCKSVIALNKSHLVYLNTDDSQFLNDIDTLEDYDQLLNEP